MTTTRKPAHCLDCGRKLTSSTRDDTNPSLCTACFEYAGWENTHNDEGHDDSDDRFDGCCPVCTGNAPTAPAEKPGHSNGKPLTHTSHAGHDHPATKKARAACRKARAAYLRDNPSEA